MNPRHDLFESAENDGFILLLEKDSDKETSPNSPFIIEIYRITNDTITYISNNTTTARTLFGDLISRWDVPKKIQSNIEKCMEVFASTIKPQVA